LQSLVHSDAQQRPSSTEIFDHPLVQRFTSADQLELQTELATATQTTRNLQHDVQRLSVETIRQRKELEQLREACAAQQEWIRRECERHGILPPPGVTAL